MQEHYESSFGADQEAWSTAAMMEPTGTLTCKACGKPTGIIHDLDLSSCCCAEIGRRGNHGKH